MAENQEKQFTPEQIKRFELASELTKELVNELQIPDSKDYVEKEFSVNQNTMYKTELNHSTYLYAEIGTLYGPIEIKFSLTLIAIHLLQLIELILSDETAPTVLKNSVMYELRKRNINMLTLFDITESEVEEVCKFRTKDVLKVFLLNVPMFAQCTLEDALGFSKLGYCQHLLKPLLKDHWEGLGLPDDFNLVTESELEMVRKYNLDRKKWFLGDKKQLLNMATLADEAGALKAEFKRAKTRHAECKESFYKLSPHATEEEWKEKWVDIYLAEFPKLHYKALDDIENHPPFELVSIHLSEIFGYDDEVMRKKITTARKMKAAGQN